MYVTSLALTSLLYMHYVCYSCIQFGDKGVCDEKKNKQPLKAYSAPQKSSAASVCNLHFATWYWLQC